MRKGTSELFLSSWQSANLEGANILLLARGKEGLEKAQKEMLAVRQAPSQVIDIQCVDLTKPDAVRIPPKLDVLTDLKSAQLL